MVYNLQILETVSPKFYLPAEVDSQFYASFLSGLNHNGREMNLLTIVPKLWVFLGEEARNVSAFLFIHHGQCLFCILQMCFV